MSIGNIFGFLDKLMGVLPIQKRKERWKNEIDTLTKEKARLLNGKCGNKEADRVVAINLRLDVLNGFLRNASDAS